MTFYPSDMRDALLYFSSLVTVGMACGLTFDAPLASGIASFTTIVACQLAVRHGPLGKALKPWRTLRGMARAHTHGDLLTIGDDYVLICLRKSGPGFVRIRLHDADLPRIDDERGIAIAEAFEATFYGVILRRTAPAALTLGDHGGMHVSVDWVGYRGKGLRALRDSIRLAHTRGLGRPDPDEIQELIGHIRLALPMGSAAVEHRLHDDDED